MIIIAGNSHIILAHNIATSLGVPILLADVKKFEDQELRIQIDGDLYEQDIVIIQSTSKPANDHLVELLLIADTARRAGARRIIAIMPYFGYSRQDRPSYIHGPISASLVASLIETAGVDRVITVDLHSKQSEGFFKIGAQNLDPLSLFIPLFVDRGDYVVVSPDIGGISRAKLFAKALNAELAIINKTRLQDGSCIMGEVIGNVANKNCILVDDIIDTGGTLCQAAELLRHHGCQNVDACITHGVFSALSFEKIKVSCINKLYVTDTINQPELPANINVISVAELISQALKRFN